MQMRKIGMASFKGLQVVRGVPNADQIEELNNMYDEIVEALDN